MPCTLTSSMHLGTPHPTKPGIWLDCVEYTDLTCYLCLDYEVSNCLCDQSSLNYWCEDTDESRYYGQQMECPAQD